VTLPGGRKAYVVQIGDGYYLQHKDGYSISCDMRAWWADIETRPDWREAAHERDLHDKVDRTLRRAQYTPAELRKQADVIYPDTERPGD
jgi:hypothetical protein